MEKSNNIEKTKLSKARRRVAEVKGFYIHLMVYLMINTMLLIIKLVGTSYYGETFMGSFWHFSTVASWFFWGIGLAFHALKVFSHSSFFGKRWEERQIQKYIEQEKSEARKFTND